MIMMSTDGIHFGNSAHGSFCKDLFFFCLKFRILHCFEKHGPSAGKGLSALSLQVMDIHTQLISVDVRMA